MSKDAEYWRNRRYCGPILRYLARNPGKWITGYDLSRQLGKRSGVVYPSLRDLENAGLIKDTWVKVEGGKEPLRKYQITSAGKRIAAQLDT